MLKSVSGYISISEFEIQRILGLEHHLLDWRKMKIRSYKETKVNCINMNYFQSDPQQHVGWLLNFHAKVPVFLILHEVTWVECFLTPTPDTQREAAFCLSTDFSRARDMWQCFDCSCSLVSHSAELLMDPIMNQIILQMTHIFFNQQIFLETADRNLAGVLGWQQRHASWCQETWLLQFWHRFQCEVNFQQCDGAIGRLLQIL